jgi:hypothetical protein
VPQVVFHYTSCQAAQEIAISGRLRPGRDGKVYLTDDMYGRGVDAARLLAIPNKAVELVFSVLVDGVTEIAEERSVGAFLDEDGSELRPGGGTERWTAQPIEVAELVVWRLTWP